MAIDTTEKRASGLQVGQQPGVTLPVPDGTIDAGDRKHLAGLYAGPDGGGSDTTPDPFSFADQTGVALGTAITSAFVTITGIDTVASISVVGGEYSINGGAFTSSAGTVDNGDEVRARHTASDEYLTDTDTVVTIGGVSDTFTSTTMADPAPAVVFIGPAIGSLALIQGVEISPRDYSLRFAGEDLTFEIVGTLPDGLSLSSAGVLSGTPTSIEAVIGLRIRATNGESETADSNAFSVRVVSVFAHAARSAGGFLVNVGRMMCH